MGEPDVDGRVSGSVVGNERENVQAVQRESPHAAAANPVDMTFVNRVRDANTVSALLGMYREAMEQARQAAAALLEFGVKAEEWEEIGAESVERFLRNAQQRR